jgi:Zn finger protein HypA/HybF involved in hydrogenase expression
MSVCFKGVATGTIVHGAAVHMHAMEKSTCDTCFWAASMSISVRVVSMACVLFRLLRVQGQKKLEGEFGAWIGGFGAILG